MILQQYGTGLDKIFELVLKTEATCAGGVR